MYYFSLTEVDENKHIGTVQAESDAELTAKVQQALNEHFDADCTINGMLKISEHINCDGKEHTIDLDDYNTTIHITQSWLY